MITAGTAVRESMELINANNAKLAGVLISVDRQERGQTEKSAIQEIEEQHNVKVYSIISMTDIIAYLEQRNDSQELLDAIQHYREEYGV